LNAEADKEASAERAAYAASPVWKQKLAMLRIAAVLSPSALSTARLLCEVDALCSNHEGEFFLWGWSEQQSWPSSSECGVLGLLSFLSHRWSPTECAEAFLTVADSQPNTDLNFLKATAAEFEWPHDGETLHPFWREPVEAMFSDRDGAEQLAFMREIFRRLGSCSSAIACALYALYGPWCELDENSHLDYTRDPWNCSRRSLRRLQDRDAELRGYCARDPEDSWLRRGSREQAGDVAWAVETGGGGRCCTSLSCMAGGSERWRIMPERLTDLPHAAPVPPHDTRHTRTTLSGFGGADRKKDGCSCTCDSDLVIRTPKRPKLLIGARDLFSIRNHCAGYFGLQLTVLGGGGGGRGHIASAGVITPCSRCWWPRWP
jgi:hypothetical protein